MKKLFIEIADTHDKRERGLQNRKFMSSDYGMLFKFPYSEFHSFWMKDTYIPLDIAFVDDRGKILQIESMSPLSTKSVGSNYRCKYALEVSKGWFDKNGIHVGSRIAGDGIRNQEKIAQTNLLPVEGAVTGIPEADSGLSNAGDSAQILPNPDIMLNLSYKERLEKGNLKGQDFVILYQTKKGFTLPPKVISPPFEFEEDEKGRHDAIVKAWDNQTGGWKSFLIDNILSLEEKK